MLAPSRSYSHQQSIFKQLAQSTLFSSLAESTLNHFAEKSQQRAADKGKVLFIQGDEAEWFYFITQGWVKIFRETLEGTEAVLDVFTNGCFFGESATLEGGKHTYSAQAVDECQLIAIPSSLLTYHLHKSQQLSSNMLAYVARQNTMHMREVEHLNVQNATQRIGCFLLRLCADASCNSQKLHLPYDKTLIAARLGMKPETFSRALAKLKSDVNLNINGSTVHIQDVQELVRYTCYHCSSSFPCEK